MRRIWALLVMIGCATEGGSDRAHICIPCRDEVQIFVASGFTNAELADAQIELCLDATSCAHATFGAGGLSGAFEAAVTTPSTNYFVVTVPGAASHTEDETWTVTLTDAHGATLFLSNGHPGFQTNPTSCGLGDCHNVVVSLQ